jgi:hypothetical protein
VAPGYVHDIDPILGTVRGVHPWWYGLGFALGFTNILLWVRRKRAAAERPLAWRRALFALILPFTLVIPSDWTQDVPARYGKRHPGLVHSPLYPALAGQQAPP